MSTLGQLVRTNPDTYPDNGHGQHPPLGGCLSECPSGAGANSTPIGAPQSSQTETEVQTGLQHGVDGDPKPDRLVLTAKTISVSALNRDGEPDVCEPMRESHPVSAANRPPSGQLPPVDPDLFARARETVQALRKQRGVGAPGNLAALKTGLRSSQLLDLPDVAAWHAEQVDAITADLGGPDDLSTLERATVREVARLEVLLAALGGDLLDRGVLTGKGKTRAATTAYLQVLDRFAKLSGSIGLRRRPKQLPSITDYLSGNRDGAA